MYMTKDINNKQEQTLKHYGAVIYNEKDYLFNKSEKLKLSIIRLSSDLTLTQEASVKLEILARLDNCNKAFALTLDKLDNINSSLQTHYDCDYFSTK